MRHGLVPPSLLIPYLGLFIGGTWTCDERLFHRRPRSLAPGAAEPTTPPRARGRAPGGALPGAVSRPRRSHRRPRRRVPPPAHAAEQGAHGERPLAVPLPRLDLRHGGPRRKP